MLTYCFQILNFYELHSLQVIISVIYEALTVLGEVQHSEPDGDDVVHPGDAGHSRSLHVDQCWEAKVSSRLEYFRHVGSQSSILRASSLSVLLMAGLEFLSYKIQS